MSTERIIVHSSIAAPFSTALESAIEKLYYSPAPAPILVTSAGAHKNKKLVNQALSKGATLVAGDVNAKEETETRMRPIVVEGVTKEMDLFHEESFGPTTSLMVVDSEEEAIALANDTEYGLSSAVFTEDLASGLRVAKQIESGYVTFIHSFQSSSITPLPYAPFPPSLLFSHSGSLSPPLLHFRGPPNSDC